MSYKSNLKLLVMLGPDLLTSIEKTLNLKFQSVSKVWLLLKNLEREDNKKNYF